MDPSDLARWTRFAAKGGIGKCTALNDCIAEKEGDLMFLKEDEITVLMQLHDEEGRYLGFCEGVVGRFSATNVRFHGKLKKPVMTKRSSMPSAISPSPQSGRSPATSSPDDASVDGFIDHVISITNRPLHERASTLPPQVTAPLNVSRKPPTASSFSSPPLPTNPPLISSSALAIDTEQDQSTRISLACSDVEVGIGLTMLQTLVGDGDDDGDDSSEESDYGTTISQPSHPQSTTEPDGPSNTRHSSPSPTRSTHNHDRETRRPSLAPSVASSGSWEGAIYDDYRYSRHSMASKTSSSGNLAGAPAAASSSEQPLPLPPPPPPVPDTRKSSDSRPSVEVNTHPSVTGLKLPSRPLIPLSLQPRALASQAAQIAPPEPSPLLHTNWSSPTSSVHDTDALLYMTSSAGRDPNADVTTPRSRTMATTAGSTVTDRADDIERTPSKDEAEKNAQDETAGATGDSAGLGLLSGQIVVDDEEELSSDILSSTTPESAPSSPEPSISMYDKSIEEDGEEVEAGNGDRDPARAEVEANSPSLLVPPPPPPTAATTPFEPRHHHRPSLADLRGEPRQSLFLPHPNAPKAPAASLSAGPMYIQSPQERQQRLSMALTAIADNARGVDAMGRTTPSDDPPPVRPNSVAALRMALSKISQLQSPASGSPSSNTGGQVQQRGQQQKVTIYGRTDIDLFASMGPVPIIFVVDPFPAMAPPPYTVQHTQQSYPTSGVAGAGAGGGGGGGRPPRNASLGYRRPLTAPSQVPTGLRPGLGFGGQEMRGPEPPLPTRQVEQGGERSAAVDPVMPRVTRAASATAIAVTSTRAGATMPTQSTPSRPPQSPLTTLASNAMNTINTGGTGNTGSSTSNTNDPIPRSNFFPKLPGARPRSRSFSGFDAADAPGDAIRSQNEHLDPRGSVGPGTSGGSDLSSDAKRSPSTNSMNSAPSSSPIRLQPLATPQSALSGGGKSHVNSSPLHPSPLSLPQNIHSPGKDDTEQLDSPVISFISNSSSSPSLPSVLSSQPAGSSTNIGLRLQTLNGSSNQPPFGPVEPLSEKLRAQPSIDADAASVNSDSRSFLAPSVKRRQNSLRSKLSLPNLRKNRGKQDETSSLGSSSQPADVDTVQIKDTDFELVRPNISFLTSRNSEDFRMDGLLDPSASSGPPRSPSLSSFPNRSPTTAPAVNWPPPESGASPAKHSKETGQLDAHRQRELKWVSLLSSVPPSQSKKAKKVRKLLLEGVPASVRYLVWTHVTNGRGKIVAGVYPQLCSRGSVSVSNIIAADVQRCFEEYPRLQGPQSPVLTVLQAYLNMVPDIQYRTGLTLIVGQLLLQGPEEEVFWIFVSLMDSYLRPYFSTNSMQLEVDATLFSRVLENNDSQVAKRMLMNMSIPPEVICSSWFTSVFVDALPTDYVNRVWDVFMYEGITFLIRVGLALVNCCRRQILECRDEKTLLGLIHHPPPKLLPPNPDILITLALNQKVKDDDIRKQRVKMEAQVKHHTQSQAPRKSTAMSAISLPRTDSFH